MNASQISYAALIESLILLIALLAYSTAITFGISINLQIYVTVIFLCLLLLLCWRNTRGGMHPCFIFLGFLLLFQGGRLLSFCLPGPANDPMRLASANGLFDVSLHAQRMTLLVITLSALCIYLPVRLSGSQINYTPLRNTRLVPYILSIFLLTVPFLIWKNYQYLMFVRSHGGYIAIYTAHDDLVAQAGVIVRTLSRISSAAFLVYFCYEKPGRRLALIAFLYFSVTVMELVIGLRGDVLLTLFVCIFLWKLKRGTHFTLRFLLVIAIGLAFIGQIMAGIREKKGSSFDLFQIPKLFLYEQGTSIGVTEAVVAHYNLFYLNRWRYIANGFLSYVKPINTYGLGEILAKDVNVFLDPIADEAGYGIGDAYLADSYLFGRLFGIACITVFLSVLFIFLAKKFYGYWPPYAISIILPLIYLPRDSLTGQLAYAIELSALISMVLIAALLLRKTHDVLARGFSIKSIGI